MPDPTPLNPHNPFTQITGAADGLFAIDTAGRVWKYHPAAGTRFAFWGALTNHRADPDRGKPKPTVPKEDVSRWALATRDQSTGFRLHAGPYEDVEEACRQKPAPSVHDYIVRITGEKDPVPFYRGTGSAWKLV